MSKVAILVTDMYYAPPLLLPSSVRPCPCTLFLFFMFMQQQQTPILKANSSPRFFHSFSRSCILFYHAMFICLCTCTLFSKNVHNKQMLSRTTTDFTQLEIITHSSENVVTTVSFLRFF